MGASFPSAYIATTSSAVSRAADDLTFPISFGPQEMTVYGKIVEVGNIVAGAGGTFVGLQGAFQPHFYIDQVSTFIRFDVGDGTNRTTAQINPTGLSIGSTVEFAGQYFSDGHIKLLVSVDGGSVQSREDLTTTSLSSFSGDVVVGNEPGQDSPTLADWISGPIIAPGVRTMDEMRELSRQ